ncbi:MAG: hypothetical protein WAL92_03760 [Thiogranum sp.]
MSALIEKFPYDGVVTVNRVIIKPGYTVDDLQERVVLLCQNVKVLDLCENGNEEIACDMRWSGKAYSHDEALLARESKAFNNRVVNG